MPFPLESDVPASASTSVESSQSDLVYLTSTQVASLERENEKRDRADSDFEDRTPTKKATKTGPGTSASAKKHKKGKSRAIATPTSAGSSKVFDAVIDNDTRPQKRLLVNAIMEIWGADHTLWPIYDLTPFVFTGPKTPIGLTGRTQRRKDRLDPLQWSLTTLELVDQLSKLCPDEPHLVQKAVEFVVAERVGCFAEGAQFVSADLESAVKGLQDEGWVEKNLREARSPTITQQSIQNVNMDNGERGASESNEYTQMFVELLQGVGQPEHANDQNHEDSSPLQHRSTTVAATIPIPDLGDSQPSDETMDSEDERVESAIQTLLAYQKSKKERRRREAAFRREEAAYQRERTAVSGILSSFKK